MTFAERIKAARKAADLSQVALANAISKYIDRKKISRTAVAAWETGVLGY